MFITFFFFMVTLPKPCPVSTLGAKCLRVKGPICPCPPACTRPLRSNQNCPSVFWAYCATFLESMRRCGAILGRGVGFATCCCQIQIPLPTDCVESNTCAIFIFVSQKKGAGLQTYSKVTSTSLRVLQHECAELLSQSAGASGSHLLFVFWLV